MAIISKRLRDSARGQPCSLQILGVCNHNPETTVLAHLRSPVKGMSSKGDDFFAIFCCSACHEALDNHRLGAAEMYLLDAIQKTQRTWFDMGLLSVPVTEAKPQKPSSKILPRKPMTVTT